VPVWYVRHVKDDRKLNKTKTRSAGVSVLGCSFRVTLMLSTTRPCNSLVVWPFLVREMISHPTHAFEKLDQGVWTEHNHQKGSRGMSSSWAERGSSASGKSSQAPAMAFTDAGQSVRVFSRTNRASQRLTGTPSARAAALSRV